MFFRVVSGSVLYMFYLYFSNSMLLMLAVKVHAFAVIQLLALNLYAIMWAYQQDWYGVFLEIISTSDN